MKFLPLAIISGLFLSSLHVSGAETDWIIPRTEHGHPDLQGLWHNTTQTPIERPVALGEQRAYTEAEVRALEQEARDFEREKAQPLEGDREPPPVGGAIGQEADINFSDVFVNVLRVKGEYRTSMIVDPPNGRFPFREDGRSQDIYGQYRARGLDASDGPEGRTAGDRCLSRGIPPMTVTPYNNNFQIVQNKDYVMIMGEMVHDARIIRLNEEHHPGAHKTWMGDAVGHWEGDTLVVHTKNFRPEISHFRLISTDQLELTERFEIVSEDEIFYSVTVTDPLVYTQPFTEELTLMRRAPGEMMYEYSCHEGNYGLEGILAGARREEWDARQ
ncbi:MAG: hypothetical protein A3H44_08585 [Gammaproteobacteria bacterium RIFCSPLOWO2_02_FULL_57_10]|nr:MAG: hypothetical protein A3H44_08585 [Gammaproteobacteria bacterium RIFCSPLOWO2_02_FULL_57_10]